MQISLLGSTGSIGTTSLDIIARYPERFQVAALSAGTRWKQLAEQVRRHRPSLVSLADETSAGELILIGDEGLLAAATHGSADLVINGLTGGVGVRPTTAAIRAGKDIALANKEVLVIAGEIVNEEARRHDVRMLPVDSEISAIWQCLEAGSREHVRRVLLTASGGPFRDADEDELNAVTPERALAHPTWVMGPKVTIDSATLMNKGFEILEVKWLFNMPLDRIEVLVHHQSIIHSLVEYDDGSVIAQLGVPDMALPIQYALTYPDRMPTHPEPLDLADIGSLTFGKPDSDRFRALSLARQAAEAGGTMPAVLSGADESAVELFLAGAIPFTGIPALVEATMDRHESISSPALDDVLAAESWARDQANRLAPDVT